MPSGSRRAAQPPLAAQGFRLYRSMGCSGCHEPDSTVHAPDLRNIFGRVVHLADGATLVADEQYLRDSILLPSTRVVAGYPDVMPAYQGQLSEGDLWHCWRGCARRSPLT